MGTRLRVYLAGPIHGCNLEQRTCWREEVKQSLKKDFDFEDPAEWSDEDRLNQEISRLEACDILVANMWKESIGTTLGVIRALQQAKPVVLIDPNHINNSILNGLVAPEKPVHSVLEACKRVRQIATEFARSFTVRKRDGSEEPFDPHKVVRSVSLAAAAAGVADPAVQEQISVAAISQLRRIGGQHGLVDTATIRKVLFDRLEWMSADRGQPLEVRKRVQAILEAWRKREAVKEAERSVVEAQETIAALTAERQALIAELKARDARIAELERRLGESSLPAPEPPPADLVEALTRVQLDFAGCLVVHEKAFESAKVSPFLDTAQAWEALKLLGKYASERYLAELMGDKFPGAHQWFKEHQGEVPGLDYAGKEGEVTSSRYGDERTVVYEGQKLLAEQHLRLGDSRDPQHCLRIHFALCGDKVVVAHCGRHLPTKSRS